MNIFVLDKDPGLAARAHMDCHVPRQLMACAQLLSCAHVYLDGIELTRNRVPHAVNNMRASEIDHKWAQWARFSSSNYRWLRDHMQALYCEYDSRFEELPPYRELLRELISSPLAIPIDELRNDWPQTMPPQYRNSDPVEGYRSYYVFMKHDVGTKVTWSAPAVRPTWWFDYTEGRKHV